MNNPTRRLTVEKHIENARLQLIQLDYVLSQAAEMLGAPVPLAAFDPKKLYRCSDSEFHAAIQYTDRERRHYGSIWKDGNPPFIMNWDSSGRQVGSVRDSRWDLVNYDNDAPPRPDHQKADRAGDHCDPPIPEFDHRKSYRCRDPEFHVSIKHTFAAGNHSGYVWQTGNPPFPVKWDSAGKYTGTGHEGWDLVNYSTPDLDSSCGE